MKRFAMFSTVIVFSGLAITTPLLAAGPAAVSAPRYRPPRARRWL